MAFINPVANVSGLVDWLYLIERQHADNLLLQKEQKHLGIAALVEHHVALHVAAGLLFVSHLSGPAQRLLKPALVFHHQLMQFRHVTLVNRAQGERIRNGDMFDSRSVFGGHGAL